MKKIFSKRPNWTALILAAIMLVAVVCLYLGDAIEYTSAAVDRRVFAAKIVEGINSENDTMLYEKILEEKTNITTRINALKNNSDLGEALAENDHTHEGRLKNGLILGAVAVVLVALAMVIVLNVGRVIFWMLVVVLSHVMPKKNS